MMKLFNLCMASLYALNALSVQAQVKAKVTSLNVHGTTATFTLSKDKAHSIPNCVEADRRQLWSLDITSNYGRALYSFQASKR